MPDTFSSDLLPLTPIQQAWLEHLVRAGATPWARMPKAAGATEQLSFDIWRHLRDADWITARYTTRESMTDHWFEITEGGRARLARHLERIKSRTRAVEAAPDVEREEMKSA